MSVIPSESLTLDISHLVIEDDTPVDNFLSAKLQRLLVETLYSSEPELTINKPFLADANVGIFYALRQPPIVPDAFLALEVEVPQDFREKRNRTYFVWEFGKPPDVVIEIVSNQEGNELGRKLKDYARIGVTYYGVFDPLQQLGNRLLQVYALREGHYQELAETQTRLFWLEQVGLGLTLWQGEYEGKQDIWLRWCDEDGVVIPTGKERAEQEKQRAEQEKQRAEQEKQRAERAEQTQREAIPKLLGMGLSVEQVAEALGVSVEEIRGNI